MRFFGAIVCGAAMLAAPLRAEIVQKVVTSPGSGIAISVATPLAQLPSFGFVPIRVTVENASNTERTWIFRGLAGEGMMFPGLLSSEFSLTVPAGQTREMWHYLPLAEPGTPGATLNFGPGMAPGTRPSRGARGSFAGVQPIVSIADTPQGKKITRVLTINPGTSIVQETDINTTTGQVTNTTRDVSGRVTNTNSNRVGTANPGYENTFIIDPATGNYRFQQKRTGSAVPAKFFVTVGPPSSTGPTAHWNSRGFPLGVQAVGAGVAGDGRAYFGLSPGATPMRMFAVTSALDAPVRRALSDVLSGAPNLTMVDPGQLPADWRVWSAFAGIIMGTDDYAVLDVGRRAALRSWVAMGGRLFLSPAVNGKESVENIGVGEITTWAEPVAKIAGSTSSSTGGLTQTTNGSVTTFTRTASDSEATDFWIKAVKIYDGTPGNPERDSLVLRKAKIAEAADRDESGGSWLAVFLFAFAGLVAPVNLFFFAPAGKRHRLFWTTPIISLSTAVFLIVFILLADGVGGAGRRITLVSFVPGASEAAVFQEQALHTGFLPNRRFALSDDTLMAPLSLDDTMRFGSSYVMKRGAGAADGDWFRSRSSQAHLLRRLTSTRGRVELVGLAPNGAPIVQSTLGVALHSFSCIDASGAIWKADEVAPGRRVTLVPGRVWFGKLAAPKASRNFSEVFAAATSREPWHWGARGADGEIAPIATLDSIEWEPNEVLYTGMLERATTTTKEAKR